MSDGAAAKVLPPSVDRSVAPAPVRTMIVSPMAETRVMATPRSATGLHHAVRRACRRAADQERDQRHARRAPQRVSARRGDQNPYSPWTMPNCSAMSATAWMITAGHSELVRRTSQPNARPTRKVIGTNGASGPP